MVGADVDADADDVITYASVLRAVTAGQAPLSPYVALADSAGEVAAAIMAHRGSRAPSPGPTGTAVIRPALPDRAPPSCPPSR